MEETCASAALSEAGACPLARAGQATCTNQLGVKTADKYKAASAELMRLMVQVRLRKQAARPSPRAPPGSQGADESSQEQEESQECSANAPLDALAAFGGFEIATLVGAVLQAAEERRVIVVDGFIATSAVLVAAHLQPHVLQRCVFAHRSGERGHALMLAHLKAEPLLDLGLRLGEGSGAALAWPLLQSSCAVLAEMASFESAGVATQTA